MEFMKSYCGLTLAKYKGTYLCIDVYSQKVKKSGTFQECDTYFDNYVKELSNRDR